jgi:hypothetical protein
MEEKSKKILIGVVSVVIIGVSAGLLYWYYQRPFEVPPPREEQAPGKPSLPSAPGAVPEAKKELPPPSPTATAPLPDLNQSDDYVLELMKGLSSHAKLAAWLKIENIIRVITASVDNIARGLSPRPHLGFLSPGKAFMVNEKAGKLYIDPQSYTRYNLVADVFASLDASKTIKVYRELEPLFQQAYRELGYPDRDFKDTLIQAIKRLISTPVVQREFLVKEAEKGINYQIVEEDLEGLSPAQKHLLRMGPNNTRKIQKKLREMALTLGVPEGELPKIIIYIPRVK